MLIDLRSPFIVGYLDDVTVGGTDDVIADVTTLIHQSGAMGLGLNVKEM